MKPNTPPADRRGGEASAGASGGPLAIRLLADVPGLVAGLRQPSVRVLLGVRRSLDDAASLKRVQQAAGCVGDDAELAVQPDGRHWVHLLGAVVLDLMRTQNVPLFGHCAVLRTDEALFVLHVPTLAGLHASTRRLIELVCQGLNAMASDAGIGPNPQQDAIDRQVAAIRSFGAHDKNTLPLLRTADRMGIPWRRLSDRTYILGMGARSRWFQSSLTDHTPGISVALARSKVQTARLLRQQGLPASVHRTVTSEDAAVDAAERMGYPVVIKPADQDGGHGVTGRIRSESGVRRAFAAARRFSKAVIMEPHFFGEDYRLHVFEGEVFRLRHRIPGGVQADGTSTIGELVRRLNEDPLRGQRDTGSRLVRIDIDEEALDMLAEAGLSVQSVPPAGQFVVLRSIANVSAGGVSVAVPLSQAHPDNLILAKRAVGALRLDLAAVDLLIPDIRRSWTESGALICEVNAQPQFGEDVPEWLYGRMFPEGGRVPFVVWLGPLDAQLLASVQDTLQGFGVRLGLFDGTVCQVGKDRWAIHQGLNASTAAQLLADCRDVDAIFLAADASLSFAGLPVDRIDMLCVVGDVAQAQTRVLATQLAARSSRVVMDRLWRQDMVRLRSGQMPESAPQEGLQWQALLCGVLHAPTAPAGR